MNKDSQTLAERQACAQRCVAGLGLRFPAAVDTMDDATAVAYAGWPERLFVIGADGRVAYAGAQGPRGFYPTRDFQLYTWPDAPPFDAGISLEDFLRMGE